VTASSLPRPGCCSRISLELPVGGRVSQAIPWANHAGQLVHFLVMELGRSSVDQIRLDLRCTRQAVYLHPTALHFGGVRWWFSCPRCGRQCAKLYLPRGSVFLCRLCHDLTYQSCIVGKSMNAFSRLNGLGLWFHLGRAQRRDQRGHTRTPELEAKER
jgi:hypothetical protein